MRLIHLTDLHLTSLEDFSFWRVRGKRRLGYLSWSRRRRFIHRPEVLDRLLSAVAAESPDQIVVSGDLVQFGLAPEIAAAGEYLRRLGPPESVMLVPGNHDLYAPDSWLEVRERWRDYLHLPAVGTGLTDGHPVTREVGPVDLIGLSSARPSPALEASGRLGRDQLARLAAALQRSAARGRFCCLALHHPPLPGMIARRKALTDAAELERAIDGASVHLVLHGHVHRNCERQFGATAIFGTASASSASAGAPAAYRCFDLESDGGGWRVRMQLRALKPGQGMVTVSERSWRVAVEG